MQQVDFTTTASISWQHPPYGPTAIEPKYLGASNLDERFLDVLNHACGSNPGNC